MHGYNWFEDLFGFVEENSISGMTKDYLATRRNLKLTETNKGYNLTSLVNNQSFPVGIFTTPSLEELRSQGEDIVMNDSPTIEHRGVTDVLCLHSENPGAVFQVASQFNCLEFTNPITTVVDGVTNYVQDKTQGPACAIACAGGATARTYFTCTNLNTLHDLEDALDNQIHRYWKVRNGYMFSTISKLNALTNLLKDWDDCDILMGKIRVGLHADVGVLFENRYNRVAGPPISVTQVYCAAISCTYSGLSAHYWKSLAKLILDACYEATIWASIIKLRNFPLSSNKVFLTFIGGGCYGNKLHWIADSMGRAIAIAKRQQANLHIIICHYRGVDEDMEKMINKRIQAHM